MLPSLPPDKDMLEELKRLLASAGVGPETLDPLGPDDDLLERGALDSLSLAGFLLRAQRAFHVRLRPGDVRLGDLRTLRSIAALLRRAPPSPADR